MTCSMEPDMNYVTIDGTVRKLWGSDAAAYGDHLLRLDETSRRNRFGGTVADAFIRGHSERAFEPENVLYGFIADGVLRGVAELRPFGRNAHQAEAAFSIERPWQSHGVGTELLERTLLAARNRGVKQLHITCLSDNQRMQQLARKFDAELRLDDDFDRRRGRGGLSDPDVADAGDDCRRHRARDRDARRPAAHAQAHVGRISASRRTGRRRRRRPGFSPLSTKSESPRNAQWGGSRADEMGERHPVIGLARLDQKCTVSAGEFPALMHLGSSRQRWGEARHAFSVALHLRAGHRPRLGAAAGAGDRPGRRRASRDEIDLQHRRFRRPCRIDQPRSDRGAGHRLPRAGEIPGGRRRQGWRAPLSDRAGSVQSRRRIRRKERSSAARPRRRLPRSSSRAPRSCSTARPARR